MSANYREFSRRRHSKLLTTNSIEEPPHTLATTFIPEKYSFIHTMEMLRNTAELCFQAGYERGTVETLNMMVRACANVQDYQLIKPIYRLHAFCYAHFKQVELAIHAFERLKDIAEDSSDHTLMLQTWHGMAEMYTRMKDKTQEALYCLQQML